MPHSRRWFLGLASVFGAALGACRKAAPAPTAAATPAAAPAPSVAPNALGSPVSAYGARSRFETLQRFFRQTVVPPPEETSSRTPLRDTYGIITPSSLHFERHHAGVPDLNPATHALTIHGLVDRPLVFTMDELKRFPSVSHIYFLECSGNSASEWTGASEPTVQRAHGLTSCSEWTGVPLSTLLRECGVQPTGTWVLATIIVWLVAMAGRMLLPLVIFKKTLARRGANQTV